MGGYLQTSTANPYGRRPWATSLYTGFENYAFLKQPQNTIIRGDVNMRPDIYRPPEMKPGLGSMTLVSGSGRVMRRSRARGLGLIAIANVGDGPASQLMRSGGFTYGDGSTAPVPIFRAVPTLPPVISSPIISAPRVVIAPPPPPPPPTPISILPPSIVPPVPQPVYSGPAGTVYALPGNATTPGSPFAPAPQSQLLPEAVPLNVNTAAAAVAASTPAASTSSFSDWFNSATLISQIPNGYLAIGGVLAIYLFSKKRR